MLAPAVQQVMHDFNTTSPSFATFCVSVFVLGFACGPLVLPPLSEMYGRVVVYNTTNVLFLGFTMLCAVSRNEAMFLVFRFLSGFAGVATITIGSGTIVDLMPKEKRGKALSVWSVGTILGPTVGPVIGGYVTEVAGWRSMFWAISVAVSYSHVVCSHPILISPDWGCYNCLFRHLEGDISSRLAGTKGIKAEERNKKSGLQV